MSSSPMKKKNSRFSIFSTTKVLPEAIFNCPFCFFAVIICPRSFSHKQQSDTTATHPATKQIRSGEIKKLTERVEPQPTALTPRQQQLRDFFSYSSDFRDPPSVINWYWSCRVPYQCTKHSKVSFPLFLSQKRLYFWLPPPIPPQCILNLLKESAYTP